MGTRTPSVTTTAILSASAGTVLGCAASWVYSRARARRDTARLLASADFAARKHATQRRKDPEQTPYVNHVIGVAHSLSAAGVGDTDVLMAALLHDTVEDTECSIAEIDAEFGGVVAGLVGEVTDDKTLPPEERKRLQVVHAPTASRGAKLVKLSDKLYNLRDLLRTAPVGWTRERVAGYFRWAAQVIEGASGVCPELEEQLVAVFEDFQKLEGGVASADEKAAEDTGT